MADVTAKTEHQTYQGTRSTAVRAVADAEVTDEIDALVVAMLSPLYVSDYILCLACTTVRTACSTGEKSNTVKNVMLSDMADEDLKAELERLRAENEALKKPARGQISLRVSEKGAVSVYGMGRFPVTLYKEQWEKLLSSAEQIKTFIKDNDHLLKKKEA